MYSTILIQINIVFQKEEKDNYKTLKKTKKHMNIEMCIGKSSPCMYLSRAGNTRFL